MFNFIHLLLLDIGAASTSLSVPMSEKGAFSTDSSGVWAA